MSSVDGGGNPSSDPKIHQQQFTQGLNLFKESLEKYHKAQADGEDVKGMAFQDVMNKTLNVMNETAGQCINSEIAKLKDQLKKDYEEFKGNPSEKNYHHLEKDIDDLKKEL